MHRFIIWTYCPSGQKKKMFVTKVRDLNQVKHHSALLLHINAQIKRPFCAVESTHMLNVDGHLTMSPERHAGRWKRNRKNEAIQKQNDDLSSFCLRKMQHYRFLHILSSDFFHVVVELQALLFWREDVLLTRGKFTSWHYKIFHICKTVDDLKA